MIADYEAPDRPEALASPRQYGLTQSHKHLPEMAKICGLSTAPVFCPIVADFYSGMEVTVPVFARELRGTADDIRAVYAERYRGPVVTAADPPEGMLAANALSGLDSMRVMVTGNDERILLVSVFDNLGKGASGAAVQNMNIILGIDETTGLQL
uniref:N-acetyl-gamma-glutamyl-phosphate reductase n=1 Tax=uncultured bacterium Contig1777_n_1791_cl TaxID=1393515 RepID=W0FRY5_9BACT|nr:N-acetyl-gamma-glutamyl-phosphate reductase [uncultured bacterium Contig1777_n_1791_cl]